jgi:NAD(P)-dependent dehydrogenase (short-subunit alcohol dehydrogenase family)
MGEAAARLMSQAGWPLLLCDLHGDRLSAVAGELGGAVETLAGDIAAQDFPARLVAALGDRSVGALIHCAGLSPSMADAARILDVNLAASMRLVDVVRPRMAEGGAAVLFASVAAHMRGPVLDKEIAAATTPEAVAGLLEHFGDDPGAAYSYSKRGVQMLVRRQAGSFGQRGARICSISPGIIDTPMGRAEMDRNALTETMVEVSALRRTARADELASVAVFLCSRAASFLTGADILVDGGFWAGAEARSA